VSYSYFPNLNVGTLTNNRDNTRTQTFTYDSLNRVSTGQSSATSGDNCWGQSIPTDGTGYDRWGNLLKVNPTKCSTPGLNVATDGLNHLSGFGYDAAGNMTNDGLYTYTYNAEGQQASTSAASQTYTYDGDGRRVKKSNGRTYWFSSVTGNLLVETDGSGTVLNQYIYFGGRRVARKDGSGDVTYYFEEPAGRTRTITGATGVACNEADYYLFGGERVISNTCDQNYHFAGMYRDGETGNDYTQFRMYESNLGRWMTPDPVAGDITNPQSLNRYAYVLNNPTNSTDPLGLKPDDANTVDVDSIIDSLFGGSFFGGGCFADGAPTPCFMVNAAVAAGAAVQCPDNGCGPVAIGGVLAHFSAYETGSGYVPYAGPGSTFSTEDQALAAGAMYAENQSLLNNGNEHCGMTYGANGQYGYTAPVEGAHANCQPLNANSLVPAGADAVGGYHSHPNDPNYYHERFSGQPGDYPGLGGDVGWAQTTNRPFGFPLSLGTPEGRVTIYYPAGNCQVFVSGSPVGTGTTIPICH
jgi:RHS repeat-associated protein